MPDVSDITDALAQAAIDPHMVVVDGQTVMDKPVSAKLEALKHLAANANISSGGSAWGKVRMAKGASPAGGAH